MTFHCPSHWHSVDTEWYAKPLSDETNVPYLQQSYL